MRVGPSATVWHDFSSAPEGGSLLGAATVEAGELRLGGAEGAGAALLESQTPAGGMPPLSHFAASFDVWAPAQPHNQSASERGYDLEARGVVRVRVRLSYP